MRLRSVALRSFRNLADQTVGLSENLNVFTGENAQGKTNFLESVRYLSTLKPIRQGRDGELVRFGREAALIEAVCSDGERDSAVSITVPAAGRRKITVNGAPVSKTAEYAGKIKTVLFCPEDLGIVRDAPSERRRLCDAALSQLRQRYGAALAEYGRLLEQKNRALRDGQENPALLDMLPVYAERMARFGAQLIKLRGSYVALLSAEAARIDLEMSDGRDRLAIEYKTVTGADPASSEEELSRALLSRWQSLAAAELAAGSCLSGPHRDDLIISVNGEPAKAFASQGQTRSAVLSIKLAEREIFRRADGEYPILLLDDVLSELDGARRDFILNSITGGQVLITSCAGGECRAGKRFAVSEGEISVSSSGQ